MIKLTPPLKKVKMLGGWIKTLESIDDLKKAIAQRGQFFGENKHPDPNFYSSMGLVGHNGLDIPLEQGEPILASHDGIVEYVQNDFSAGFGVVIRGNGFKTIYWHNLKNKTQINVKVRIGDIIALGDNTGLSTGDHLHFGIKLLDSNNQVTNRDNGYDGAVDPLPYLVWWDQTMVEYRLVKADKDIYRIKDGHKDLFLNAKSFTVLDGRWSQVEQITQQELDGFPDGNVLIAVGNE